MGVHLFSGGAFIAASLVVLDCDGMDSYSGSNINLTLANLVTGSVVTSLGKTIWQLAWKHRHKLTGKYKRKELAWFAQINISFYISDYVCLE